MVASMLREDLVHEYRKNERNKIKNSLKKCLQNCKVNVESGYLQCFLLSFEKKNVSFFLQKVHSFHLRHLGPSKDADN
jgi:hypothetical protein